MKLHQFSAFETVQLLRRCELSPIEVVKSAIARIEQTDPQLNAMPIRCFERALAQARDVELLLKRQPNNLPAHYLCGLPIAVKDVHDVVGVTTSFGSEYFQHNIPKHSDAIVATLEHNGAIPMGKTNIPQFAIGASTFNTLFGITRNPWNTAKSVAGSSGGSAAAVAAEQVYLATGTDLGGSLRTPASFNGIVGFRPSPPSPLPFTGANDSFAHFLSVPGPMGRNVQDVSLMMDAMGSFPTTGNHSSFSDAAINNTAPKRIAVSANLNNLVPIQEPVYSVFMDAVELLQKQENIDVISLSSDINNCLEAAKNLFPILRGVHLVSELGYLFELQKSGCFEFPPEINSNIEYGYSLSWSEIGRSVLLKRKICEEFDNFLLKNNIDVILTPSSIVEPFDAGKRYVESIEDFAAISGTNLFSFENYFEWIAITYVFSVLGCPAISLPYKFTQLTDLPVGIQVVGRAHNDAAVISISSYLEKLFTVKGNLQ